MTASTLSTHRTSREHGCSADGICVVRRESSKMVLGTLKVLMFFVPLLRWRERERYEPRGIRTQVGLRSCRNWVKHGWLWFERLSRRPPGSYEGGLSSKKASEKVARRW